MTELAEWLQHQVQTRDLTQALLAVYAGLAQAIISDILRKDHIPRVTARWRLQGSFLFCLLRTYQAIGRALRFSSQYWAEVSE